MKYSTEFASAIITCILKIDKDVAVLIFTGGVISYYLVFKIPADCSKTGVVSGYINHGHLNKTWLEITSPGRKMF